MFEKLKAFFKRGPLTDIEIKFLPVTPTDASFQTIGIPKDKNDFNFADAAANLAWVNIAVSMIAETCAMLPLKIYSINAKGKKTEVTQGFQWELINRPSMFETAVQFRQAMFGTFAYSGNAFLYIDRENNELWPLRTQHMSIVADQKRFIRNYVFRPNGQTGYEVIQPEDMIHVKKFNPLSYFYGLSPLQAAWSQVSYLNNDDRFWETFWKEGGRVQGVFTSDGPMSETTIERLKEALKKNYSGTKKMQANMVLDNGLKFQQIGVSQKDAQLLDKSRMTAQEILAAFKIPQSMAGILDQANFSNMEVQERHFYKAAVLPMLRLFEEAFSGHPVMGAAGQLTYEFDTSSVDVLKESDLKIADIGKILLDSGQWTANEVRDQLWQMMPLADGNVLRPLGNVTGGGFGTSPGTPVSATTNQIDVIDVKAKEIKLLETTLEEVNAELLAMPPVNAPKIPKKSQYSKEQRDVFAKSYDAKLEKHDNALASDMAKIFRAQKEVVLKNLRSILKAHGPKITKDNVDDALDGLGDFEAQIRDSLSSQHEKIIDEFGLNMKDLLESKVDGYDANWNFKDPRIERFIKMRSAHMAGEINDFTLQAARDEIAFLYSQGGDLKDVSEGISAFFDGMEGWRSMRIARTETGAAAQEAIEVSYAINKDVLDGREWVTARDDRVRDSHQIDGQVQDIDSPFILANGDNLLYPLDPGAPPEEVINCRCTTVPVIKSSEES